MTDVYRAPEIRGTTIRLHWTKGPTQGMTHEHVFHRDGTVEWRSPGAPKEGGASKDTPEYAALKIAEGIFLISYLAASGYTLTVVLDFHDSSTVGFASGAKEWYPVQGTFEVVNG